MAGWEEEAEEGVFEEWVEVGGAFLFGLLLIALPDVAGWEEEAEERGVEDWFEVGGALLGEAGCDFAAEEGVLVPLAGEPLVGAFWLVEPAGDVFFLFSAEDAEGTIGAASSESLASMPCLSHKYARQLMLLQAVN